MSIETVKQVPILDIAKRLGIDLVGEKACCFAHEEKTPSLTFNAQGNYFKCFGCGVGGSPIDLVRLYLDIGTREAISWIEREYNLGGDPADYRQPSSKPQATPTPPKAKEPTGDYSAIYQDLLDHSDKAQAISYLLGRGISEEITERAGIRVAPRGIEKDLIEKYGEETLLLAGIMAISKKSGRAYYTLYNTRLIIPYKDRAGQRITNLQGRNIDSSEGAKYQLLRGIDTTPYNLEALDQGKTLYLCEGALDALSCYQLGLHHPLAFPGVQSFKEDYYSLLEPYRIIVAGDMDNAGQGFYRHLVKGFLKKGKRIQHLDYTTLKKDYGVTAQVKDLNDIAKQADKSGGHKRVYSKLVNDTYTILDDGGILFDSGVMYDRQELQILANKQDTPETLERLHLMKKHVTGEQQHE